MAVLRIVISCGVLVMATATPAGAETLPGSVRACIGLADAGQRLACYDREVARLIAPPDTFAQSPAATAPAGPVAPVPAAGVAPAPATASPTPPPPEPRHLTAKVSAVQQSNDYLVVTLDSGEVWEQTQPATSQLNLRPGDVVKLDREMGGWFLSNRYGDNIQVRLRRQPDR